MNTYVLGHSGAELQRLTSQARFIGDLTEEVLRRAGLSAGMHVLDLGCGTGDVSFLAASLVGNDGFVLGIDQAASAIHTARARAQQLGFGNVRFDVSGIAEFDLFDTVDAVIGRLILLHMPDRVEVLRRIAHEARSGTLIVFHEMDLSTARSVPDAPLCREGMRVISETFLKLGVEIDMGSKLYPTFLHAGLPAPQMLLSARIEGGPDAFVYQYMTDVIMTLLPAAERFGIATAQALGIDTFAERLRDQVVSLDGVMQPPAYVGAWTRVGA
jgi:SAM-dependent methyltransferase